MLRFGRWHRETYERLLPIVDDRGAVVAEIAVESADPDEWLTLHYTLSRRIRNRDEGMALTRDLEAVLERHPLPDRGT